MNLVRSAPLCALALLLLAPFSRADLLVTKDGRRLEGKVVAETASAVKIKTGAGEIEVTRDQIASLERGKTRAEELAEREKAARTAEDWFQVGKWADEQKLKGQAKRAMKRAVELDRGHAGANTWLGRVLYRGEWLEADERDRRAKADSDAASRAQGLVPWQERWVTPEEKAHLERGDELIGGKWLTFAEAQRTRGLEEFEGAWLPRAEGLGRADQRAVEKLLGAGLSLHLGPDALITGPYPPAFLAGIAGGLQRGRAWFETVLRAPPGLELFGGRLAEFYVFEDDAAYVATIEHLASRTTTVPPSAYESLGRLHGFVWWDPYPLSSARRWKRNQIDLEGHCYHHWGHMLLNRLDYDGRLLPPWFDEGFAALLEFRTHARNDVFCRGSRKEPRPAGPSTGGGPPRPDTGTKVGKGGKLARTVAPFDAKAMQDGEWKAALLAGLSQLPPMDDLASLQFDELESADIAASMAIVEWLETQRSGGLRAFLDELRRRAPAPPRRVLDTAAERVACYEAAFLLASGLGWRAADEAWRAWIASP